MDRFDTHVRIRSCLDGLVARGVGPTGAVPRGLAGACWTTHALVAKGA